MNEKFIKPEFRKHTNPVDYFNRLGKDAFAHVFSNIKGFTVDLIADIPTAKNIKDSTVYHLMDGYVKCSNGLDYSLFEVLTIIKYNSCVKDATTFVEFELLKREIPYIRVGNDYFKIINTTNKYGFEDRKLKGWKKETIVDDYSRSFLKEIPSFDEFTIIPDNKKFIEWSGNSYNLYNRFNHVPSDKNDVTFEDFITIHKLMTHIFGDQVTLGYKYMKVIYEYPKQILPVLCLVSSERQTGKTTFLTFLSILLGSNYVQTSPSDVTGSFNHVWALRNVIGIDETVINKQEGVEKIKALATQKQIIVNQKHISQSSVDFYAKIVIATNYAKDFIRVEKEEIRFWVRKVPIIKERINDIEMELLKDIPHFLKYLIDLPDIDFSRSRMVFTAEEIENEYLDDVKKESYSALRKDIELNITDIFENDERLDEIKAAAKDIKLKFYQYNTKWEQSYILKVMRDEMKLPYLGNTTYRFATSSHDPGESSKGRHYHFRRCDFIMNDGLNSGGGDSGTQINEEIPF